MALSQWCMLQGPSRFAATGHAMRHMERITVAAAGNEPVLLVGETGTGKTTLVQQVAQQVGTRLVVLNLSQQTDSSDLLGGFRPVQPGEVVLPLLEPFADIVRRTWRRGSNDEFLGRVMRLAEKKKWGQVVKAFRTAMAKAGLQAEEEAAAGASSGDGAKKQRKEPGSAVKKAAAVPEALRQEWLQLVRRVDAAEAAAAAAEGGFAFSFVEGALVKAVREGWWLLLDEINLAPAEVGGWTGKGCGGEFESKSSKIKLICDILCAAMCGLQALERIAGLLEDNHAGSIVISERGDAEAVPRHPNFRLFAAMNPATDAGKRDLPAPLRNRFTEVWVAEPPGREDLAAIVAGYLRSYASNAPVDSIVDFYLKTKAEAVSLTRMTDARMT